MICDACGDHEGTAVVKVGHRSRRLCPECAAELIDGKIPRLPHMRMPYPRVLRRGAHSRGEEVEPSPWGENAVRALEGD